jgi:hypothetical protein
LEFKNNFKHPDYRRREKEIVPELYTSCGGAFRSHFLLLFDAIFSYLLA